MKPDNAVVIRDATRTDLEDIEACARSAYQKYVQRIGKAPAPMVADFKAQIEAQSICVAQLRGKVLGYVVFYPREGRMHLENIAVLPAYSGRGIGTRLVTHVETRAKHDGLPAVELYTNAKMTENLAWYPKLGYTLFDHRVENGFDRVFFAKKL